MSVVDKTARAVRGVGSIVLLGIIMSSAAAAPTGGFLAVLNEQNANGDSMRSVMFFDADTPNVPLFSVFVGYELPGNFEDPSSVTVDPATGDVYVMAFDSGPTGTPDPAGDTQGDLDLYRIPFATVYDHWATNFEGQDVQTLPNPNGWGPPPTGTNNSTNLDYVTYGTGAFDPFHSNAFLLPGAITKIGEINRGNGGDFFPTSIEFIDQDTLFTIDDSVGLSSADDPLDDHSFRTVRRVSTSPGAATSTLVDRMGTGTNYRNGGYNGNTAESWEAELIQFVQLDGAGHSEPESAAYYDAGGGLRGVWVSERDMPATGDTIAFLQLDANGNAVGYRPQVGGGSPFTLTLSDNPAIGEDLMGQAEHIHVDRDTGDLIIVESGFGDAVPHEPGVLRVPVNYDNGLGEIEFGTWSQKLILNPTKDPGDSFLERGQWTAYDSVNDTMYFFAPGGGGETPEFELDIYALDLTTGVTTSYLNVDDSVNLFFGDSFGDKVVAFNLAAGGLLGDYNSNGIVDAADYTVWRDNLGSATSLANDDSPGVDQDDYTRWKDNFGDTVGGGSSLVGGAVPEPTGMVLTAIGLIRVGFVRRRTIDRAAA